MKKALILAAAIAASFPHGAAVSAQGGGPAPSGAVPVQAEDDGLGSPGAVPTKRPLRPIPGYPKGGALPPGGTYGRGPGVYPQRSDSRYPTSRTYYDYSPYAPRQDSYGRMRSSGGQDIDVRGDQMGVDWYRNMPAPNYDYRGRRY